VPKARHALHGQLEPVGPLGLSRFMDIVCTTPLRTWLFHGGPAGLKPQTLLGQQ